jgi:hypothetical protein
MKHEKNNTTIKKGYYQPEIFFVLTYYYRELGGGFMAWRDWTMFLENNVPLK